MLPLILHDLCFRSDLKEINVIGVDFYSRDGERSYVEGYNTMLPNKINKIKKTHEGIHNKALNLKVIKNIIDKGWENHNKIDIILEENCVKYFKNNIKNLII